MELWLACRLLRGAVWRVCCGAFWMVVGKWRVGRALLWGVSAGEVAKMDSEEMDGNFVKVTVVYKTAQPQD